MLIFYPPINNYRCSSVKKKLKGCLFKILSYSRPKNKKNPKMTKKRQHRPKMTFWSCSFLIQISYIKRAIFLQFYPLINHYRSSSVQKKIKCYLFKFLSYSRHKITKNGGKFLKRPIGRLSMFLLLIQICFIKKDIALQFYPFWSFCGDHNSKF